MVDTINPASMATDLATAYISGAQTLLANQTQRAQSTSTGLTKLQSALSAFDSALAALSGKKSMTQRAATVTGTAIANVKASASAQPGSYSLFVEQTATFHQVAFKDLPAVPVALGGPLVVKLQDGSDFKVDLTMADQNSDGTISNAEIARAINLAEDNTGKVTATSITSGGSTQLVLTSGASGEGGQITLDTSGMSASPLKDALAGGGQTLVTARDAVVWLGAKDPVTGIRIQQGSNTFTAIDGVTMTLNQAMADDAAPATVTIANDGDGTAANVQGFIDAYNTLEKALDALTQLGKDGAASAVFASDAGVRALRSKLSDVLRTNVGGVSLMDYGVKTSRDGTVSLDRAKLDKTMAAKPDSLDTLFGSASLSAPSGVFGAFQSAVDSWTDSGTGQIKRRKDSLAQTQKSIDNSQDRLETQYTNAYNRYLAQFTKLQQLQSQMSDTSSLFSSMANSG